MRVSITVTCIIVMTAICCNCASLDWYDAEHIGVHGRAFEDTENFYDRLPSSAKSVVRGPVWTLSQYSAGMYVPFVAQTSEIWVNYTMKSSSISEWHFPSTGKSGVDLWTFDNGTERWRWIGTLHNTIAYPRSMGVVATNPVLNTKRKYLLFLPTYNAPISLSIGISSGGYIDHLPFNVGKKPIVWYGTSILQGAVASRPGRIVTNMITRQIGRDVYNFGFSGNGIMELSVAEYLVQVDAALYIIDCLPNMNASMVTSNTIPLVNYIRSKKPDVPIVLAEGTTYGGEWFFSFKKKYQDEKRAALRTEYNKLLADGNKKIYYVTGDQLWGPEFGDNPTVGGTHPTDLGMFYATEYYKKYIPTVLDGTAPMIPFPEPYANVERGISLKRTRTVSELADEIQWIDVKEIGISGRAFNDTPTIFNRLPSDAKGVVRDKVWGLGLDSTGLFVSFSTDSEVLAVNYTLVNEDLELWHMPRSGCSGMDLQAWNPSAGNWSWVATVSDIKFPVTTQTLFDSTDRQKHTYLLFLPIRNYLSSLQIGITKGATLTPEVAFPNKKPIVWYGTSIVQGGVASRPSRMFTNEVAMALNRTVYNFGFAGNGEMEISVQKSLNRVDAALFLIDCLPNMNAGLVTQRTIPLVKYIRAAHPTTPIVLAEGTTYGASWLFTSTHDGQQAKRNALSEAYKTLQSEGVEGLSYVKGDLLFGDQEPYNPTVGGTHPSDLGIKQVAKFYQSYLKTILKDSP